MGAKDGFLKSKAFEALDDSKKQLIKNFLNIPSPDPTDILGFISRINSETPLTALQQKALLEAFAENLSPDEKRKTKNILEIIKAFS